MQTDGQTAGSACTSQPAPGHWNELQQEIGMAHEPISKPGAKQGIDHRSR
jgi:hypothetical protein